MLILDTDILSLMEWQDSPLSKSIRAWLDKSGESVFTTVINYEEQTQGWMSFRAKARTLAKQVEAYRSLNRNLTTFCKIPVLDFDETAAVRFQDLQRSKLRVGVMDLKIAAIVLSQNGTLVTRNKQDFTKIPSLKLAEWE